EAASDQPKRPRFLLPPQPSGVRCQPCADPPSVSFAPALHAGSGSLAPSIRLTSFAALRLTNTAIDWGGHGRTKNVAGFRKLGRCDRPDRHGYRILMQREAIP